MFQKHVLSDAENLSRLSLGFYLFLSDPGAESVIRSLEGKFEVIIPASGASKGH